MASIPFCPYHSIERLARSTKPACRKGLDGEIQSRSKRNAKPPAAVRPRALAAGALALGAFAIGALAVGSLAIGALAIYRARIKRLEIDELVIRHLHREKPQPK